MDVATGGGVETRRQWLDGREELNKRGSFPNVVARLQVVNPLRGTLPMTTQYPWHVSHGRSSVACRHGGADDTLDPDRTKIDTRLHVAAVPNEAPLVDTRTVGMASTYTGEHKDWPEWSFEFAALMGSANPESIEAVRWAAMEANPIAAAVGTSGSTTHSKYGVV